MKKNYYSLEVNKSNRITRIFQLGFGITCLVVALVWMFIDPGTLKKNGTFWITIIFLLGFAYFQIASGLGRAEKFIEIGTTVIKYKNNSILPVKEINASEIQKIEIFPVNIVFILKSGKNRILRFGTTFIDVIEPVKKEVENFSTLNRLSIEFREEFF